MIDLIIDGNYILSKLVFTLHKNKILYGHLYKSIETAIDNYSKIHGFSNIYLVSDSREKSWRKTYYPDYKLKRKKNQEIDWDFCYKTYNEYKQNTNKRVKVLESSSIEGDDWISFLVNNRFY